MASGDTIGIFTAYDNMTPASSFATFDIRNSIAVCDFDDTTEESGVFLSVLPNTYAGNGITVYIHWWATSATSGDVVWSVEFANLNTLDIDSIAYDSAVSATSTTNATNGIETITSVALLNTEIDSISSGTAYIMRIKRVAANVADTMVGDAELFAIELKET